MNHIKAIILAFTFSALLLSCDSIIKQAFACDYQPEPEPIEIKVVSI